MLSKYVVEVCCLLLESVVLCNIITASVVDIVISTSIIYLHSDCSKVGKGYVSKREKKNLHPLVCEIMCTDKEYQK